MDPQKLKKLADLFGCDLSGWQITWGYVLELDHGLAGNFPAIDQDKEPIVTLDKSTLEKVLERLEQRPAKVTSLMVVAHPASGVAFNLEGYLKGDTEPLRILSAEAIDALCKKKDSVRWAPGLF